MRILGYRSTSKQSAKINFDEIIFSALPKQSKKTDPTISELQRRVQELERQLKDEKLRSEAYIRLIQKAEQELNIPIIKKRATK